MKILVRNNMDRNLDRTRWRVTDILVSLFILIAIYALFTIIISRFLKPSNLFLEVVDNIFLLVPVYYLNNKYPLKVFSNFNGQENLKYFLIGTVLCVILNIFYGISARLSRNAPEQYSLFIQYSMFQKLTDLVNSLAFVPLLEEIFFRGFIFRILRNRYDVVWGTVGSTIIFILFHGFKIETAINIGILGVVFAYVYQKTDSILLTALTHSICSASWLILIHHGLKG